MKVITIGRSSDNDITIHDGYVGRNHLQIIQHDDGHYTLIDLNSTNGTFVNGKRVFGEVRLGENDFIRIGNTVLPWKTYFEDEEEGNVPLQTPQQSDIQALYEEHLKNVDTVEKQPLISIPSEIKIKKEEVHSEVSKRGDDFSVGFFRQMGNNIGNLLGNTIGCIGSIILFILFATLMYYIFT